MLLGCAGYDLGGVVQRVYGQLHSLHYSIEFGVFGVKFCVVISTEK